MPKNEYGFEAHDFADGDKVRMVDVGSHTFGLAAHILNNGEVGTVVNNQMFLGLMPTFEVVPDSGKVLYVEGALYDRIPFAGRSLATIVKIEELE